MKNYILTAALLASASFCSATPALAIVIEIEDALCPIETIGEAELDSWSSTLVDTYGQLTDAQTDKLGAALNTCAEKFSWSEKDSVSALEFNLSVIASTAIGDKLKADGIDAEGYETVLDDRSAAELKQVLDDPENSAALKALTDLIVADFGEKLTDEIIADIATYVAFVAQSRFSALKLMGGSDQ
jgi:hypothetical protein